MDVIIYMQQRGNNNIYASTVNLVTARFKKRNATTSADLNHTNQTRFIRQTPYILSIISKSFTIIQCRSTTRAHEQITMFVLNLVTARFKKRNATTSVDPNHDNQTQYIRQTPYILCIISKSFTMTQCPSTTRAHEQITMFALNLVTARFKKRNATTSADPNHTN